MTDIAQLGYSIDTASVDAATASLDKHAAAAAKVAAGAKAVGAATGEATRATSAAKAANDNLNRTLDNSTVRFKSAHAEAHHLVLELLNIGKAGGNASQALSLVQKGLIGVGAGLAFGVALELLMKGFQKLAEAASEFVYEIVSETPAIERELKQAKESVDQLTRAYAAAKSGVKDYGIEALATLQHVNEMNIEAMKKSLVNITQPMTQTMGRYAMVPNAPFGTQGPGAAAFSAFTASIKAGMPDVIKFREELSKIAEDPKVDQGLKAKVDLWLKMTEAAKDLQLSLQGSMAVPGAGGAKGLPGLQPSEILKAYQAGQSQELDRQANARKEEADRVQADLKAEIDAMQKAQETQKKWDDTIRSANKDLDIQHNTLGMTAEQAARYREEQTLLNQAQQMGIPITTDLRAQIEKLADGYGRAAKEQEEFDKTVKAMDDLRSGAKDVLGAFVSTLQQGASAADAFKAALASLEQKLIDMAENMIIAGLFGAQGTAGGGAIGGLISGAIRGGGASPAASGGSAAAQAAAASIPSVAAAYSPVAHPYRDSVGNPLVLGAAANSGSFTGVGHYLSAGAGNVDPRLTDILSTAAKQGGFDVKAFSGYRPGDPRFHGRGLATDISLIGPDGKPIPNYQNASSFRAYEDFAQHARMVQQAQYPELNDNFRWGGYFGGPKGKYGAMDLMHFDLGGSSRLGMAGGSWAGGLNPAQRGLFPGAESLTMAQEMAASAATLSTSLKSVSTTAQTSATNFASGFAPAIGQIIQLVAGAIGGGAGAGGGGLGGILASIFHDGGTVGSPAPGRRVSPMVFAGAQRFHNGLAPDEFPAILQRGERVTPRGKMAGGDGGVHIGGHTIVIQGDASERTVGLMRKELQANNARQSQELQRDLGGRQFKFANLRGG